MTSSASSNDPVFLEKFRRAFKSASILGLVQIGCLAVYLLVAEIIRAKQHPFIGFLSGGLTGENRPVVRYAFYAAAIAVVLVLRFIHGRQLRKMEACGEPGMVLSRLFVATLIDLTMAEIPALLGLILFLIAGYNWDFYVLLFVSLFLLFMYLPRLKNWEDILQNRPSSCPR